MSSRSKKHRKRIGSKTKPKRELVLTREQLEAFAENDLSKRVLIPLFDAMGYVDVRFRGGSSEVGKDLTMWKIEATGPVLYGVVVKAEPITGDATKQNVMTQVTQCLGSQILDRQTNQMRDIDRCIVVCSREIKTEGDNALRPQLKTYNLLDRVEIIDGLHLLGLLKQHRSPQALLGVMHETHATLLTMNDDHGFQVTHAPNGQPSIAVGPKRPDAPPPVIQLTAKFPDTDEGRAKLEEFKSSIERGTPLKLGPEYIENLELPELMRVMLPSNVTAFAIETQSAGSSSAPINAALTVFTEDDELSLPFLAWIERAGTREVLVSNRQQNVGFEVALLTDERGSTLTVGLRRERATFDDVADVLRFQAIRARRSTVRLKWLETNEVWQATLQPQPSTTHPEYVELVRRVVRIGRALKVSIRLPQREYFTPADVEAIRELEEIVATNETRVTAFNVPTFDRFKETLPSEPLILRFPTPTFMLLDTVILLGPAELRAERYTASRTPDGEIRIESPDMTMRFMR